MQLETAVLRGKIDLIATGLGEAPAAVNNATTIFILSKSPTQTFYKPIKQLPSQAQQLL